jgi:hypothetical protein
VFLLFKTSFSNPKKLTGIGASKHLSVKKITGKGVEP